MTATRTRQAVVDPPDGFASHDYTPYRIGLEVVGREPRCRQCGYPRSTCIRHNKVRP